MNGRKARAQRKIEQRRTLAYTCDQAFFAAHPKITWFVRDAVKEEVPACVTPLASEVTHMLIMRCREPHIWGANYAHAMPIHLEDDLSPDEVRRFALKAMRLYPPECWRDEQVN